MSVTTDARPTNISSANVLIVDDHDLVAMSLALCLRSEGMHAQRHAARSRDGILTAVATLIPGVVLLDLDLGRGPDGESIDGTTLVAGLCRNGWRVIVLSATVDDARIGRALDAGALACVPKTAALPVLITAIRRATQGLQVMHPERRRYYVTKYQEQQEQAQAVERRLARLTDRERAVLEQLARGRRAQSIAEEFRVSLATTRTQIRAVLQKLEVNGQLEAVALLNDYRRATRGE
ncbi:MAG TPA: response regulator transcription factor [Pseudonocardia sp.]|nr:response regulator transcription factor [Pseudonocardia sp.]